MTTFSGNSARTNEGTWIALLPRRRRSFWRSPKSKPLAASLVVTLRSRKVISIHFPLKRGTTQVISAWKFGSEAITWRESIRMSFSRGGLAAILQNTCVARTQKMVKKHSKRKITLKVEIHGQKPTTSEAIQAYGKGIITFSAEKPNTWPMRTDFF